MYITATFAVGALSVEAFLSLTFNTYKFFVVSYLF